MILRGRFGKGVFNPGGGSPLPDVFWADPMTEGAMDLYRIEVYENSYGSIEADATLFASTDPDFDLAFTMTEAGLEAAIETAGWSKGSEGLWELSSDIALIDVTITNLNAANLGERAAIGCCAAVSAFDEGCLDIFTFDVDALIGGQTGTMVITGAAPFDTVIIGDSFNGGGPINMPWGTVYLTQETVTVRNVDTEIMNYYELSTPVCVVGEFYVGAVLSHIPGEYVISVDQSTPYFAGNAFYTGTNTMYGFNPYNLMANQYPPAEYGTYWCLRAGY